MRRLLLAVLVFLIPAVCLGTYYYAPGTASAPPAGGTLLVGDDTTYNTTAYNAQGTRYYTFNGANSEGYVAESTGDAARAYIYLGQAATRSWNIAIYDSSNNLLGVSDTVTTVVAGLNEATFSTPVTITSGQTYKLAFGGSAYIYIAHDNDDATDWTYDSVSVACTPEDPFTKTTGITNYGKVTIYVTTAP